MAGRKSDFTLPTNTLDELFSSQEERDEAKLSKIRDIPLEEIDDFPDHPFQVREDEDMFQLVESIKERGVITPATVRQKEDGRYELTPSLAMSVLKAYRGMGIGTLLLTQMLLAEKAAGYAKISLSVQKDNYAVKLYRKAGFTTVKETTEEYIMVADLNSICKMEEENGF